MNQPKQLFYKENPMRSPDAVKSAISGAAVRLGGLILGAVASVALFAGAASAEPALWVVKGKDATIYLFGTVHLLKPDAKWLTPKVEKAFNEAQTLKLEIANLDDQAAAQGAVMKFGLDLAHPLSSKLNEADRSTLAAAEAQYGLPAANLEPLKPWLAGLTFSVLPMQKAGFDPKSGVELKLLALAHERKETVAGFETIEQQMGYFDGLPVDQQVSFLREAIDKGPKAASELERVEAAWEKGDVETIGRYMNEDMKKDDPRLYDLLLTKRNERFADQIVEMLKGKGVTFVAVGAAHLAGSDSVQSQLAKRGIQTERK